MDEVKAAFVPDDSTDDRVQVWEHFELLQAAVRSRFEVAAAWLGGSFTTSKEDPSDLDVVAIIPSWAIATARGNVQDARIVTAVEKNVWKSIGLRLDTFLLPWPANPEMGPRNNADVAYLQQRGYWDDFWQRLRSGPKGSPAQPEDALPKRGYLEVILDGFNV